MTRLHDNGVINIAKLNLLNDIINPPKLTTHLNTHYSPIIHGCMNTRKVNRSLRTLEFCWIVDVVPIL